LYLKKDFKPEAILRTMEIVESGQLKTWLKEQCLNNKRN